MDVKTDEEEAVDTPEAKRQAVPELMPDVEPAGPLGPAAMHRGVSPFSPLNARRWRNFKTNRRGYWSLWLFLVLFVGTLFAEFIANDKPLYVSYAGKAYFPVFFTYPETTFGGDFETATDYRDPFCKS